MSGRRPTRLPTLSDYDIDNHDDYAPGQSGSWDKGAGSLRSIMGGPKMDLRVIGSDRPTEPWVAPSQTALGHRCAYIGVADAKTWCGSHTGRTCLVCGHPEVLPRDAPAAQ